MSAKITAALEDLKVTNLANKIYSTKQRFANLHHRCKTVDRCIHTVAGIFHLYIYP